VVFNLLAPTHTILSKSTGLVGFIPSFEEFLPPFFRPRFFGPCGSKIGSGSGSSSLTGLGIGSGVF